MLSANTWLTEIAASAAAGNAHIVTNGYISSRFVEARLVAWLVFLLPGMHADWAAVVYLQYDPESAPALALKATMERTEKRFANYAKAGLLCGADGLPHLISDPGLALKYGHAGEVFVSTLQAVRWGDCMMQQTYAPSARSDVICSVG